MANVNINAASYWTDTNNMTKNNQKRSVIAQKNYRKTQANKGLVRFELQVSAESKEQFEKMVAVAADEYDNPWDPKRRMAKARAAIFNEITQGTLHEFVALKQTIKELKEEIKVLSPAFFLKDPTDKTPLPAAIKALPDDPVILKQLLAKTYSEAQEAKQLVFKYRAASDQYEKLYNTVSRYNDELIRKTKKHHSFEDEDSDHL